MVSQNIPLLKSRSTKKKPLHKKIAAPQRRKKQSSTQRQSYWVKCEPFCIEQLLFELDRQPAGQSPVLLCNAKKNIFTCFLSDFSSNLTIVHDQNYCLRIGFWEDLRKERHVVGEL